MKRTAIAALAAIVGLMLLASGAEAASRLCRQLESRLAEVSTGGGRQATRYDRAIETQRGHLDRVDRQPLGIVVIGARTEASPYYLSGRVPALEDA